MSYYYKYQFTSPEPIFAIVQEEFKSYFDTGAVDTLLFGVWLDKCLKKLGKGSYGIKETLLQLEDFESRLPDNFYQVREAWLCTAVNGYPYQSANSFYVEASQNTVRVDPIITTSVCDADCLPNEIKAVYKTNNTMNRKYTKQYLLSPGNISVHKDCSFDCANFGASSPDSFDIRDNKFVTNFRNGNVYLVFYGKDYDNGYQLVPDNYRIMEFIEAFIKFKVFEQLSNQINDETSNQIQGKLQYYKQQSDEAYILADIEVKKQNADQKIRAIKHQLNSFNKFELPVNKYRGYNGFRRN